MRRWSIFILIFVLLLAFSGCNIIEIDELPEEDNTVKGRNDQDKRIETVEFEGPTVKTKAPTDIKIALVPAQASLSGCIVPCEAIEEIGDRYDWEIQIFDGAGTPDGQNSAIMNAAAWGAEVIVAISLDARSVQQGIKAANDAKIPIVSASNGTDEPNPRLNLEQEGLLDFVFDVGPDYYRLGETMTQWMEQNSDESGKVVVYSCPGSKSVEYFEEGLLKSLENTSLIMEEDVQRFTFEQLGDELNRKVIGYLTSYPDTEYVFLPFDPAAVSVTEGLETAGFSEVKVLGVLGNEEMISLIRQGTVATATAAYDNVYLGYAVVDQVIRLLNGQKLASPRGENIPFDIIDSTNLPKEQQAWSPNMDYKSQYYSLWD